MSTVSALVTHPLQARQSASETLAVSEDVGLIKSGLMSWPGSELIFQSSSMYWSRVTLAVTEEGFDESVPVALALGSIILTHSWDGPRKSSKSVSLVANIIAFYNFN